ncbi:hypothetical protein V501_08330 [Pseudogymnoascus sp. VKM F-4519 (FW-2642)]|nr:hypothetical protein V501_08330 [Pseudogymnoascus sp. VKM F-4519 (FW-2642)]
MRAGELSTMELGQPEIERCTARPGLEESYGAKTWSKGQAMELKGKTGAHHPLKLSTGDEIGKMYTAHYAPSRTVYGQFGQFGQSEHAGTGHPHCVPSTDEVAPLAGVAVLNQRTDNTTTTRPIPSADPRFRDAGEQLDACSVVDSADRGARGSAGVSALSLFVVSTSVWRRIVGLAQSPSRDFHATNSEVGSITAVASSSPSLLHERSREEAGVGVGAATATWTTRGVAAPRHIRNAPWERVWLGIVLKPRG